MLRHKTSTAVEKGVGVNAFTRNSGQWMLDYNNIYNLITANISAMQGMRYDGSTAYNTDALGNPLTPSNDKLPIPKRVASTAYTSGQKVWATASDKLNHWYTCTIAGTSAGTPTFPVSGTVTDGTVTWTYGGRYNPAGWLSEPASVNKCTCYGVPRVNALSAEKLTTAQAACDSGWTFGDASWSLSNGTLVGVNGSNATAYLTANDFGGVGRIYTVTYTLTLVSGSFHFRIGSGGATPSRTTVGTNTYTDTVRCLNSGRFYAYGSGTFNGSVDNISVKENIDAVGTQAYYINGLWQQGITNMTLSGDTNAVLSIVTDQTELVNAKLDNLTNDYKVYDLTTTAAGVAQVDFTGAMAAVISSLSVFARVIAGTATLSDSAGGNAVAITGSTYSRVKKENFTATVSRTLRLTCAASSQIRFIIPDLEEQPFVTSLKPSAGGTASRIATLETIPLSGNMPKSGNNISQPTVITQYWTPQGYGTAGQIKYILSSRVDASNYTALWYNGVIVCLEKKVAGVSEYVTFPLAAVIGTTYKLEALFYVDGTCGLKIDGVSAGSGTVEKLNDPNFDTGANWTLGSASTPATIANGVLTLPVWNSSCTSNPNWHLTRYRLFKYKVVVNFTTATARLQLLYINSSSAAVAIFDDSVARTNYTYEGYICADTNWTRLHNYGASAEIASFSWQEILNNTTNATKAVFGTTLEIGSFNGGTNNTFALMGETSIGGI
jgi:hypothetical protein